MELGEGLVEIGREELEFFAKASYIQVASSKWVSSYLWVARRICEAFTDKP